MPELPEVETTRRGIEPYLLEQRISRLVIRQPQLRWPIPQTLIAALPGKRIESIERRAKYLLVNTPVGSALLHLGMSGSLRVLDPQTPPGKHDHYDWLLDSGRMLRFTDPRRFGSLLWQPLGSTHDLLARLGPEPLGERFDGDYLWRLSRGRSASVKTFIMDQAIVVGVGNIYAAEALFAAGIHPRRKAGSVSRNRYANLAEAIKRILSYAIERGGTTLRDFISPDGVPGYFEQELFVYGRAGEPCRNCGAPVRSITLGQRSTFYCPRCQR
ncbi:MAG TPA: bifunctional DNA-formamidopyrimidine glycosylase/DNA-(apurinic or apyrimidinic site) lyase [Dokdonella sp.]|uniref:bifunctional DNA-formamidopyrimidine glycosylase/DNA-(apurinic or apyrimidinic site) lyase n=1 Tax=Dokdonella sp. TaxID=2291710 RepID=UPI002D7EC3AA|nr:bifunctional DNA-formamidopyrimidine glycosylase/DNA-(apurinic or apyrimidinic site) lyase [Dokdonella sp.]HET9034405.1 bifunctional DNA-formamidopyrimidine glycosylase/DNA-(apurinic or apyrimidinic site) lyase [Dokdonella sp.]